MGSVRVTLYGSHAIENNLFALVDEEDFDLISKSRWHVKKFVSTTGKVYFYAEAKVDGKQITMHRFLTGAKRGEFVDHEDHNTLNNTRKNIRVCTHAQNMQNRPTLPQSLTGVKGVHYRKEKRRYQAEIKVSGKRIRLGSYKTIEEAKAAYDAAAKQWHGEFASLS